MMPIGMSRGGVLGASGLAIPDGMVNRWPFDEGSGSTVADTVGTDDGTIEGASWQTGAGNGGSYLDFNGTADRVATGAIPATGSQNRTIACWISPNAFGNGDNVIVEYGTNSSQARFRCGDISGSLGVSIGAGAVGSSLSPATDGSWQAAAVVLDGSTLGDLTFYLDGSTDSPNDSTTINTGSNEGVHIGRQPDYEATDRGFDGGIDDPIWWDRALSVSELNNWVAETEENYP